MYFQDQKNGSETHYHITQSLESKPKDFVSSSEEEMITPQSAVTIAAAPPGGRRTPERLVTSTERNLEDQIVAASRDIRPEVSHLYNLSKDELVARSGLFKFLFLQLFSLSYLERRCIIFDKYFGYGHLRQAVLKHRIPSVEMLFRCHIIGYR